MKHARNRKPRFPAARTATMLAWVLLVALTGSASAAEFTLRVDGMACPFCAYGIEKKLLEIPGVEKLTVLMDEGKIVLTLAEGADLDVPALHSAVNDAGFTLRSLLVDEAEGQLTRDAAGELLLTSVDPTGAFKLNLKQLGTHNWDSEDWPIPVLASGTVTDFESSTPELVVSKIEPRAGMAAR